MTYPTPRGIVVLKDKTIMERTNKEESDEHIVKAALEQAEWFAVLIDRYTEKLSRYLGRIGVRGIEDREDILQDVFLKAYRNLNDFDTSLSFSSWIYRIAHNESVSFFRKKNVRPEGHLIEESEEILPLIQGELDTSELAEQNINAAHLTDAMSSLEEKYRDILVLRFFEGHDYSNISDIMEMPMGSVATLIHRAKKQLADKLEHIQ
jgi:RNA polymerase sigma-70 factor, ECF subfamily